MVDHEASFYIFNFNFYMNIKTTVYVVIQLHLLTGRIIKAPSVSLCYTLYSLLQYSTYKF